MGHTKITEKELRDNKFLNIAINIGRLVHQKNVAYGNSFKESGQIMRILYPNGIAPEQMDNALLLARIIDKMFRIATMKSAFGENPFRDIAGYGICGASLDNAREKTKPRGTKTR